MTLELNRERVEKALEGYIEPYLGKDLVHANAVEAVEVDGNSVHVKLALGYPADKYRQELAQAVAADLEARLEGARVTVDVAWKVDTHVVRAGLAPRAGIKNIIAVASGKGGVGKSTTTVNLALALAGEGARVGILDADIYGPSVPRMLGIGARPESKDGKSVEPMESYGVQAMSIGFLIDDEEPMIWRGPMVTQALMQLVNDTRWRDLDYLLVDMPPGTGDVQLTLAQQVPVTGAVVVSTPQEIALLDARKSVKAFERVGIPVLGIVENMSTHICSNCGHEEHIFSAGGGQRMAMQYRVDLLGSLPLNLSIRENADNGYPSVVADPTGPIAQRYRGIALRAAAKISLKPRGHSGTKVSQFMVFERR